MAAFQAAILWLTQRDDIYVVKKVSEALLPIIPNEKKNIRARTLYY